MPTKPCAFSVAIGVGNMSTDYLRWQSKRPLAGYLQQQRILKSWDTYSKYSHMMPTTVMALMPSFDSLIWLVFPKDDRPITCPQSLDLGTIEISSQSE